MFVTLCYKNKKKTQKKTQITFNILALWLKKNDIKKNTNTTHSVKDFALMW